jgi:hypothetical protein
MKQPPTKLLKSNVRYFLAEKQELWKNCNDDDDDSLYFFGIPSTNLFKKRELSPLT